MRMSQAQMVAVLALALVCVFQYAGCAGPGNRNDTTQAPVAAPEIKAEAGANVKAEVNQTARNQTEQNAQATKVDGVKAKDVTVNTTYGALDGNTVKLSIIGACVLLGILLGAIAAPSPDDLRLVMMLYLASAAAFVAAFSFAWKFFLSG